MILSFYKSYNYISSFFESANINSNDYFNYKGSDYKGEYGFIVLYASCEDTISKDNEPLILVINNKKLSKLNSNLIELKKEVCEFE